MAKFLNSDRIALFGIFIVMTGGGLTVAYNLTDRLARIEERSMSTEKHLESMDSKIESIQAQLNRGAECRPLPKSSVAGMSTKEGVFYGSSMF